MSLNKKIIIACSYPITTARIGGMDYFFWEFDKQLKIRNYNVSWLFSNSGAVSHYIEKELHFESIGKESDFTEGMFTWLNAHKDSSLFLGVFLDYQSSVSKRIKNQLQIPCFYVDQMSRSIERKSWKYNIKRMMKGMLFYPKIDGIIAISDYVKTTIYKEIGFFWKNKITVIYNALPIENFVIDEEKNDHEDKIAIFCIGHLIKEKGFQVAIEACRKLHAAAIPFKLTIAGDGILRNDLEALAKKQLPIGSYEFLGNITNQPYYLNQSDIVVIPSLWKEAFGYTVVEAMLMKKVVFASNIGGIPEIIDNESLLFEAGNDEELFLLFKDYHANKKKYEPFAERLYERARSHFSLDMMVADYIIAIEKYL